MRPGLIFFPNRLQLSTVEPLLEQIGVQVDIGAQEFAIVAQSMFEVSTPQGHQNVANRAPMQGTAPGAREMERGGGDDVEMASTPMTVFDASEDTKDSDPLLP
jgi:hypothetical protein